MDTNIQLKPPEKPRLRPIMLGEYRGWWLCYDMASTIGFIGQTAGAAYFGWLTQ